MKMQLNPTGSVVFYRLKGTDEIKNQFFQLGSEVIVPKHEEIDYHAIQPVWQ